MKVVYLGDQSVWKTSLVLRASGEAFDPRQQPTVGAHYFPRTVSCELGSVRIWDTAGEERYRSLAPFYYQRSKVAIVVFSLVDESTFAGAGTWISEPYAQVQDPPKIFLVGNKSDLMDRVVDFDRAVDFTNANNAAYFETSAKTGQGIRDRFAAVAAHLLTANCAAQQELREKGSGCGC